MPRLNEVLDTTALAQAIEDGYVRERFHPENPALRILNYAEKAQYEKHWTSETRKCRGLIVRGNEVVARSWPKFFNYGEHPDGSLDLDTPHVQVTDKADGSLGILYYGPNGWAIATRGSFASEQAAHATELLYAKYLPVWTPADGVTYLFEIVFPDNRIVLDYGTTDELILLGVINTSTGRSAGPDFDMLWPGPRTRVFDVKTLGEALTLPPRPNAEGLVVRFLNTGLMVKIKQDDYVRLHKLITGLSERAVWEHLTEHDGDYTALLESIPDEFHGWVKSHAEVLLAEHGVISGRAHYTHGEIVTDLNAKHGGEFERRDYAIAAQEDADRPLLFLLLDGRDISPSIWKSLKPFGSNPMKYISEDVA